MGIVYRAVQPLIGKQVAIKVLKAEFAEAGDLVKRLLVEAQVVNAIRHRGVIDIFGFGQLPDGRPYVVMELLQGVSLDVFIRQRGRVKANEAARILDEMLAALGAAHRGGVIHRDLKPGNVFLEESGGSHSVKLLDFGIAKVASQSLGSLTMSGHVLGTPEYMAPEQIRGERVEPTADLYAVGVIAFQLLTGRRPFIGEQMQVIFAQVEEEPPRPSSLVPDLPVELERIVLKLLAKRPSQRFQSTEAVRQELEAFLPRHGGDLQRSTRATEELESSPTIVLPTPPSIVGVLAPKQKPSARSTISSQFGHSWRLGAGALVLALTTGGVLVKVFSQEPPSSVQAPKPKPAPAAETAHIAPSPPPSTPEPVAPIRNGAAEAVVGTSRASEPATEAKVKTEPSTPPRRPARAPRMPDPTPLPIEKEPPATSGKHVPSQGPRMPTPTGLAPNANQPTMLSKAPDHEALQQRLADAAVRLRRMDERAVSSPAMARLMEIQGMADLATTEEQRTKAAAMLDAWERKFLLPH
uniref:serine/threonine-protein kinase n=1 Tax=Hyalangium versicolor TaxID=2861190 RepID=UPI0035A136A6